ncbi:hypothetical protein OHAE_119 [Ochrobactrum soli]|uniref:Uncharacterized protein n=1 Tax=Ochrobactrum soli TaxID=2448455 RepID=A0A2P9HJM2_9HYPH|nr:hypothetical protein OHAE_119 [[Ochrobactrum] soli]
MGGFDDLFSVEVEWECDEDDSGICLNSLSEGMSYLRRWILNSFQFNVGKRQYP